MPPAFRIDNCDDKVVVSVNEPGSYRSVALSALIGPVVGYILIRSTAPRLLQIVIGLFVMVVVVEEAISSQRGTHVQLQVGKFDLISRGHGPGDYSSSTIARAIVERFEYREATGGGDGPNHPEGLYVEWSGIFSWPCSKCILPRINESQADAVIEAIYMRFPDTGKHRSNQRNTSDLVSLNLYSTQE